MLRPVYTGLYATSKRMQLLPTLWRQQYCVLLGLCCTVVQTDKTCKIRQFWELLANNFASVCTRLKHHDKLDQQWQCCRGRSVFNISFIINCFNYIESLMQKLCQPIYKKFKRNLITILILTIITENISKDGTCPT